MNYEKKRDELCIVKILLFISTQQHILTELTTQTIRSCSSAELCLEIGDPADTASLELWRALKEHLRPAEGQ